MKQIISAVSITSQVYDWLASSTSPQILHVFDRACNLINERRDVLSLVTQEIGHGPFNLVVESDVFFAEYLTLESPVYASAEQLSLGGLTVHIIDANRWDPRPDWKTLHDARNAILWQICQLSEIQIQVSNLRGASRWGQFSNWLSSSVAMADIPSCMNAAQKLAGLGPGLTPSGDDFIMGAIYATWILHPHELAEHMTAEIAKVSAALTTSLSAAWLRAASKGEAGILWHRLFDGLLTCSQPAIQQNMVDILFIGATSGADALAGFIDTIVAYKEIGKKHVIP